MLLPHASDSVVDLAHVVHYGIVFAGLAGIVALLAPAASARWLAPGPAPAYDDHTRRVLELRQRIGAGTLAVTSAPAPPAPTTSRPALSEAVLPVVVVSSGAAAGVHAAVTPAHLSGGALVAGFFLATAFAQLAWAVLARTTPGPALLRAGAIGNAAVVAVWLASRTVGLPTREPVGPWDVASVVWELVVVLGCLHLLRRGRGLGAAGASWHPVAGWWLGASVVCLGILSVSGASA